MKGRNILKTLYGIIAIVCFIGAFVSALDKDVSFTILNTGLLLMNVMFMNNED